MSTDFSPHLNERFFIHGATSTAVVAELIEVTELGGELEGKGEPDRRRSFSLLFRCKTEESIGQGTYKVKHEKLGELEIFLVPVGPDEEGTCLEAVFN